MTNVDDVLLLSVFTIIGSVAVLVVLGRGAYKKIFANSGQDRTASGGHDGEH